ncbi:MAG: hypothetical protein R3293_17325, partial [Candidatus Promineifilaceae bacterium]|nr:hypothetical protein [Candidatus Promineifilaceae bacterium]
GHGERFFPLRADLMELPPIPCKAFFFDPARRDESGKRLKSVALYRPSMTVADRWLDRVPHAAVKISPGVDYDELPPDAEVEFISLKGAVKEAVLWYGDFHRGNKRRATLLPGEHSLSTADYLSPNVPVTPPSAFLYEPDGAVIRAHLVQTLARQINATLLDAHIAYLTADKRLDTPFARCYTVEGWFPFQLKRLRQYLRERRVGLLTIKKRGSPLRPQALEKQLRLRGDQQRTLFLTQVNGRHTVIITHDN